MSKFSTTNTIKTVNNQNDADLLATFEIIEDIIGALATGKENKYYNAIKGDKNE